MRWRRVFIFASLVCGALSACNPAPPATHAQSPKPPPQTNAQPVYQNEPLPKLRTVKLWLGPKELTAEIAATPRELATGMMHRKEIGEQEGMLFLLPFPQRASFYMRNTQVPLSCAYVDREGTILEIYDLQPLNEQPVWSKSETIQFVLETKQGWFERNGIPIGTVLRTEHGSMMESFFRNRPR